GQVGGQQSLWVEFASDIADDDEANRNRWQASVIPNRCASGNVQLTRLVVVPGQGQASPERIGSVDKLLRGRQASAFLAWTAFARVGPGRLIQSGIQAQARNDGQGLCQGRASVQKVQGGIRAICHENQGAIRQPATHLMDQ